MSSHPPVARPDLYRSDWRDRSPHGYRIKGRSVQRASFVIPHSVDELMDMGNRSLGAADHPQSQILGRRPSTHGSRMARARPFLDLLVVDRRIDPAFDDRKAVLAVSVRASRSAHRTGTSRFSPAAPSPCPSERVTHTANPVVDSTLSRSLDAAKLDTVYSYS